jgi:hypothetical protein
MLKAPETRAVLVHGEPAEEVSELALGEISVTSMSSVPGTVVTAVRADVAVAVHDEPSAPEPVDEPETPPLPVRFDVGINYFPLLDGLVAHLGAPAVRAHLSTILSDAHHPDSNADRSAPPSSDSDAGSGDSQGASRDGSEPSAPNTVPMEERLAFLRAQFLKANP